MNRVFVLALCLGLFGCVTVKPVVGPDGTENQLITCPAVEQCYAKAHEVCGGPYKIVNTSSDVSGVSGTTTSEINLLVKCGR